MKYILTICLVVITSFFTTYADWTQSTDLSTNRIVNMATSGTTLFGLSENGTLYRSVDNGGNWSKIVAELGGQSVAMFTISGSTLFGFSRNGIFRSMDSGDKWEKLTAGLPDTFPVTIISTNNMVIAEYMKEGAYRSTDNGDTWIKMNSKFLNWNIKSLTSIGSVLYMTLTERGVFKSSDKGENWIDITNGLTNFVGPIIVRDTILLVGTRNGVYRSYDKGESWKKPDSLVPGDDAVSEISLINTTLFQLSSRGSVFSSADDGNTRVKINSDSTVNNAMSLATIGTTLFIGTSFNGVYKSTDKGNTWTRINKGFPEAEIITMTALHNTIYAGSKYGTLYTSTDNGTNWIPKKMYNSGKYFSCLTNNNSVVFASTYLDRIFATTDNGNSFISLGNDSPGQVFSMFVDDTILYVGTSYVKRSTDNGATWVVLSTAKMGPTISAVTVIGGNVICGNSKGEIWVRSPKASAFVNTNSNYGYIHSFQVSGNKVYAAGNGGVYISIDSGVTWKRSNTGLANTVAVTFAVYGNTVFVGTQGGVFSSNDNGATWAQVASTIPNVSVNTLAVSGNNLYAGTTEGIWKTDVSALSVSENNNNTDLLSGLSCYPNPTGNSLTINSTSLPFNESSPVTYTLSTLTGNKLMQFKQTEKQFSVSLGGIASGVYSLSAIQGGVRSTVMVTVVE